jgi:PAS domain S-box-containing protein
MAISMSDETRRVVPPAERVLEHLPDALVYTDAVGTIQGWNDAAEQLFGFCVEEAVGKSLDLIIPEELRAAHWRGFNAAASSGHVRLGGRPTLTRAMHKSGGRRYVEMSFALVFDEVGQAVGSVATARDVTAKVEREKAQARAHKVAP